MELKQESIRKSYLKKRYLQYLKKRLYLTLFEKGILTK